MIKKAAFWEILIFNLLPLILVISGSLEIYHFLLFFILEVLLMGVGSVVKWAYILGKVKKVPSPDFGGGVMFMLINVALVAIPLLFVLGMTLQFYPDPEVHVRLFDFELIFADVKLIALIVLMRIIVHHVNWVRDKKYQETTLKRRFYMLLLTAIGGFFVFLIIAMALDRQMLERPILMTTLLTIMIIGFEIWNGFFSGSKQEKKKVN